MSIRAILVSSALVLAATAVPAFADSGTVFLNNEQGEVLHPTPSTVSRAQVLNDLAQFQRNGSQYLQVGEGSLEYPDDTVGRASEKSRAQVRQETLQMSAAEKNAMRRIYTRG